MDRQAMVKYGGFVVVLFVAAGCAQTTQKLASTAGAAAGSAAAPAAIREMEELDSPRNRERLTALAYSPAVEHMSHEVGLGLGRGIVEKVIAIATGNDTTRPGPDSAPTAGPGGEQAPAFLRQTVDPALAEMIRTAVQESLRDATSPDGRGAVRTLADAIGDAAVGGAARAFKQEAGPALAQMVRQQLGPAVREQMNSTLDEATQQRLMLAFHNLLEREIIPAVRKIWDQGAMDTLLIPLRPEISPAVVQNSHNFAVGTSIGTRDAMVQLGLLSPAGALTGHAKIAIWGIGIVLILVGLAAAALLVVLLMIAVALWRRAPLRPRSGITN